MNSGPAGSSAFSLLIALTLWGLLGCAGRPVPEVFPEAGAETALVRWQRGTEAVTGQAQLRRNPAGAVRITLTSPAEAPSLEITLSAEGRLSASGPLIGRSWSGPPDRAPAELRTWHAFLSTWQQAAKLAAGAREIHSPAHRIAYEKSADKLRSLSVASSDVRESVSAAFLPSPQPSGPIL